MAQCDVGPRRLVYVSASRLPSADANAVHVAQMCEAFAGLGCSVRLRATRGSGASVVAHYDLHHHFDIDFESPATHRLWLIGRRLRALLGAPRDTLYYGRRLPPLARLGRWGYPSALELHHPPRTTKQLQALQGFIVSPGFLGLVVISEMLRTELLSQLPSLAPNRILVARDGVRSDRIRTPTLQGKQPIRAVYCGSFHVGKGVQTLLPAAALLPEIRFELIGGTPEQIDTARRQAPPNVHFLGQLPYDESQRRLRDYDIALAPYGSVVRGVQTPAHESLAAWMSPLKLFEYMGAGLPIVTSDLPVLREILRDNETALMPAPDEPAALADAIRRLANDSSLRLQLARTAQAQLRDYTWEHRAQRILDFLRRP